MPQANVAHARHLRRKSDLDVVAAGVNPLLAATRAKTIVPDRPRPAAALRARGRIGGRRAADRGRGQCGAAVFAEACLAALIDFAGGAKHGGRFQRSVSNLGSQALSIPSVLPKRELPVAGSNWGEVIAFSTGSLAGLFRLYFVQTQFRPEEVIPWQR